LITQARPPNAGKLIVYIRLGSSTDPSQPATPDEIALMGQRATAKSAALTVAFGYPDLQEVIGNEILIESEYCEVPDGNEIHDLKPVEKAIGFDISMVQMLGESLNPEYFRELACFEFYSKVLPPPSLGSGEHRSNGST